MSARKRPCEDGQRCAWKQGAICAGFPIRVKHPARDEFYPAYREVQSVSLDECARLHVAPRLVPVGEPPESDREFFNQNVLPIAGENTRRLAAVKAAPTVGGLFAEGDT